MMEFSKDLINEMGGPIAALLGQREGLNAAQSKGLLESLAPIVLGGLKRKKEEGVDLEGLVTNLGGREESLDNLGSFFDGPANSDLGAGGVLGLERGQQAADAISQKTGIGSDVVRRVLPMLIPVVMAFLMKKGRQDTGTPDRRSGLEAILDRDGDGGILDDIAGMVLSSQGGRRGGGLLGSILSQVLRR